MSTMAGVTRIVTYRSHATPKDNKFLLLFNLSEAAFFTWGSSFLTHIFLWLLGP
jgi:hypothetical protein